jgi:beta-xylosidase
MIFRSKSPLGPYEEPPPGVNPLVCNSPDDPHVRQTGHADLVQAEDGRWWGVLLATRRQVGVTEQIGRETFLVPVDWPEGGWPVFNKGQPVGLTVLSDDLPRVISASSWRDDFSQSKHLVTTPTLPFLALINTAKLDIEWYHLRTPLRQCYTLESSRLALYGNAYTIDMQESPAMLLRKQTSYSQTWTTQVSLEADNLTQEAGAVVFWSRWSYIAVFIRKDPTTTGIQVVVRWIDETTDETKVSTSLSVPLIRIGIDIDMRSSASDTKHTSQTFDLHLLLPVFRHVPTQRTHHTSVDCHSAR